uniref:filamin-C-like isoform X2 n=1 Tax=Myxine glutinosa TaxID=7769 RepID=UPI00358FEB07
MNGRADENFEMATAEKELADDAPWKKIQKNTFTRWCNEHLKVVGKRIGDLQKDFSDGLRLIALLEVLSQKKMYRKYHGRPTFRQMQLENVSVALEFLEKENIKLVSIDSKAIMDGNLKLILGLVWTLILHYSISMPVWEGECDVEVGKQTPKQRLLGWIQNKLSDLPVTNFNRDWQDGRALGALVDSCAPGLCPDWESWDMSRPVENAREAMQQADEWLGVAQVIAPEEIVHPDVDEHSIMTYLSQFPKAKLKPGAPLRPKLNPKMACAYGPGVEPVGNLVSCPSRFVVETVDAGLGQVLVYVEDPDGHVEEAKVVANNDSKKTFSVVFVPRVTDTHKVTVLFAGQHIPQSPFLVAVIMSQGDATQVAVCGPGIECSGCVAGKATFFDIYTAGAGPGAVQVDILDPGGRRDTVQVALEERADRMQRCMYRPLCNGPHTVHVRFAGTAIPNSPFPVHVTEACNPGCCRATGRGLQGKGLRMDEPASFRVQTKNAGSGELRVSVKGPGGEDEVIRRSLGDGLHEFEYRPPIVGRYVITITWGSKNIPRSPFEVLVGPPAGDQKVRAWGPGLEMGLVGHSADFVVEALGSDVGALGFSIEGPSQAHIECDDQGDGSCDVRYWPTEPGAYAVHVLCDDEDIEHSPFMAYILPVSQDCFPDKVQAFGEGIETNSCIVEMPAQFTVDTKAAGKGPLKVFMQDVEGEPLVVTVHEQDDRMYLCQYVPEKAIKHTVVITWGGASISQSPFRVNIGEGSHPYRVRVDGPGVEKAGVKASEPTYFTVDCSEAGQGDVEVTIYCTEVVWPFSQKSVDLDIIKNENGTFTVKYTPSSSGNYTITVLFAEQEIPHSPFKIKVDPSHDVKRVKVEGPGVSKIGVEAAKPTHFTVQTKGAGKAALDVEFSARSQGHKAVCDFEVIDNHDYSYTVKYTPLEQGELSIGVMYGRDHVTGSPFTVAVAPPLNLHNISLDGLATKVSLEKEQTFWVDLRGAGGLGQLDVVIMSAQDHAAPCHIKEEPTGRHCVTFILQDEGPHRVEVFYDQHPVPGSPFMLEGVLPPDACKVQATGIGLSSGHVGQPACFTIDMRAAGAGELGLTVEGPSEAQLECVDNRDGTYEASYLPRQPGDYLVNILFAGEHISGSPFRAVVEPEPKPVHAQVSGTGLTHARIGQPARFCIDFSNCSLGPDDLSISVKPDQGPEAHVHLKHDCGGVFNVTYTPYCEGRHVMSVNVNGRPITGSPTVVDVKPKLCLDAVVASGQGLEEAFVRAMATFTIDTASVAQKGGENVRAFVAKDGKPQRECHVEDHENGTYSVEYMCNEAGPHLIEVTYDAVSIPGSPFQVSVIDGCDSSRVRVHGPGVEAGHCFVSNKFMVETREAGVGGLNLHMDGPFETRLECHERGGNCEVEYVPFVPGNYGLHVTHGDKAVPGSPFHIPVLMDPSRVRVSGTGEGSEIRAGEPQSVCVSCGDVGGVPLAVSLCGPQGIEPVEVVDGGGNNCLVQYVPKHPGLHALHLACGGVELPCSPLNVDVLPSHEAIKVHVSGAGVSASGVLASLPTAFYVDTREAEDGPLIVNITDMNGHRCETKMHTNEDGTYTVSYTPEIAGQYTISISYAGNNVPNSPYHIQAFPCGDASKCFLIGPGLGPVLHVGEQTLLSVDSKTAGQGKVTCHVDTPGGGILDTDVSEKPDSISDVFFEVHEPGPYIVSIFFGGQHIPNSPFCVSAVETKPIIEEPEDVLPLCQKATAPTSFLTRKLNTERPNGETKLLRPFHSTLPLFFRKGHVTGEVLMPSGSKAIPEITDNHNGTVTIHFSPTETGLHKMSVHLNGQHISGSPLQFFVNEVDSGHVCAYGPGLSHGQVNEAACFTIDTKHAGEGGLSLAIEGPSKAEITCNDNNDGTCLVSYMPIAPGDYTILVNFDGKHILGSPFTARVTARDTIRMSEKELRTSQNIPLKIMENDLNQLSATITAPSGREDPCSLKWLQNGQVGISFTPKEPGKHLVSVRKDGRHIVNSPFMVKMTTSEIGDASRVRVAGRGLKEGQTFQMADFTVDTTDAGYGGMNLAVEGPSKVDINCEDLDDGKCQVSYCPTEPGIYSISIKFSDEHIPGSPFSVLVSGEGKKRQTVTRQQQAAVAATIGSPCELLFQVSDDQSSPELTAEVTGPSGRCWPAELHEEDDGTYIVAFVPYEKGPHTVIVLHNGQNVTGSPFRFTVGPLGDGGAHRVQVGGSGLEFGKTGIPAEFSIWAREAGAGGISVVIDGPSKANVSFADRKDDSCVVSYVVQEPGQYEVSVKFNDIHVPGSPFYVPFVRPVQPKRPILQAQQHSLAKVQDGIQLNGWNKNHSPNSSQDDHLPTSSQNNHIPSKTLNGSSLTNTDSPEEVSSVLEAITRDLLPGHNTTITPFPAKCDARKVTVKGVGVTHASPGQLSSFTVDCSQAGDGVLLVGIHGPSLPSEEVHVMHTGRHHYNVTYILHSPGDYALIIKWGDEHIPGSPFGLSLL